MSILVIKLGALGDIVLADSAFQAIRNHHPQERLILLTTPHFESFTKNLGVFDEVWILKRFKMWDFVSWFLFLKRVRSYKVSRIYDLQMVNRTKRYYYFLRCFHHQAFEWVGHVSKSPFYLEPAFFKKHPEERFEKLLQTVGIQHIPQLDIRRLQKEIFWDIPKPFVLMCPSASSSFNNAKKWHQQGYRECAIYLNQKGFSTVIIGGPSDDHSYIANDLPFVLDLTGKTSFEQVITLASKAAFSIGNDTGPIHIAAASQCPVFVLFSKKALPSEQVGARGQLYCHLTFEDLSKEPFENIVSNLNNFISQLNNY